MADVGSQVGLAPVDVGGVRSRRVAVAEIGGPRDRAAALPDPALEAVAGHRIFERHARRLAIVHRTRRPARPAVGDRPPVGGGDPVVDPGLVPRAGRLFVDLPVAVVVAPVACLVADADLVDAAVAGVRLVGQVWVAALQGVDEDLLDRVALADREQLDAALDLQSAILQLRTAIAAAAPTPGVSLVRVHRQRAHITDVVDERRVIDLAEVAGVLTAELTAVGAVAVGVEVVRLTLIDHARRRQPGARPRRLAVSLDHPGLRRTEGVDVGDVGVVEQAVAVFVAGRAPTVRQPPAPLRQRREQRRTDALRGRLGPEHTADLTERTVAVGAVDAAIEHGGIEVAQRIRPEVRRRGAVRPQEVFVDLAVAVVVDPVAGIDRHVVRVERRRHLVDAPVGVVVEAVVGVLEPDARPAIDGRELGRRLTGRRVVDGHARRPTRAAQPARADRRVVEPERVAPRRQQALRLVGAPIAVIVEAIAGLAALGRVVRGRLTELAALAHARDRGLLRTDERDARTGRVVEPVGLAAVVAELDLAAELPRLLEGAFAVAVVAGIAEAGAALGAAPVEADVELDTPRHPVVGGSDRSAVIATRPARVEPVIDSIAALFAGERLVGDAITVIVEGVTDVFVGPGLGPWHA